MNLIERATVLHYHRHRLATHGAGTAEALGWRGADSQQRRFEVVAAAVDAEGRDVLDLGCGTGDLLAFLRQRTRTLRYLGIDQQPEFVDAARLRFAGVPDAAFALAYFDAATLPRADIVVASGALGYRTADPLWLFNTVARMWLAARDCLVFNVLDARHFPVHPLLVGHDVDRVEAFCRTLAPSVDRVTGYLADDVTLVMRRQAG